MKQTKPERTDEEVENGRQRKPVTEADGPRGRERQDQKGRTRTLGPTGQRSKHQKQSEDRQPMASVHIRLIEMIRQVALGVINTSAALAEHLERLALPLCVVQT